jgi:hypothetical protein
MDVSITYLPSAPHPVWWPVIANFILWARSSRSYYWSQAPPQNTQPSARPRFAFSSALQKQVMGNTEGYKQRKSEQKVHNYSVCIQFADNEAPLKRRYTYTDHTAQQPRNKLLHTRSRQNLKPHTVCWLCSWTYGRRFFASRHPTGKPVQNINPYGLNLHWLYTTVKRNVATKKSSTRTRNFLEKDEIWKQYFDRPEKVRSSGFRYSVRMTPNHSEWLVASFNFFPHVQILSLGCSWRQTDDVFRITSTPATIVSRFPFTTANKKHYLIADCLQTRTKLGWNLFANRLSTLFPDNVRRRALA